MPESIWHSVPSDDTDLWDLGIAGHSILPEALGILSQIQSIFDPSVREQTLRVYSNLNQVASYMKQADGTLDFSRLPILELFVWPDRSISLWWTTSFMRVAISLESDPGESAWYFVTTKQLQEQRALGKLPPSNSSERLPVLQSLLWNVYNNV